MRAWQAMRRLGFVEAVIVSCQFSSPHKKEFAFLLHGLDPSRLEVKCPGGHTHVKIQGQLTKRSAVYTWALADHLANEFSRVLRVRSAFHEQGPDVAGLDSVVSNDLPPSPHIKMENAKMLALEEKEPYQCLGSTCRSWSACCCS